MAGSSARSPPCSTISARAPCSPRPVALAGASAEATFEGAGCLLGSEPRAVVGAGDRHGAGVGADAEADLAAGGMGLRVDEQVLQDGGEVPGPTDGVDWHP